MAVGTEITRVDARDKVTGAARYTGDLEPRECLVARVVHSTIANGVVKSIDTTQAECIPGVVKILTCFDVPDLQFPTPGHPWSVEAAHQDVSDRKLLNRRVRAYGDDIAAVVAEDSVAADRAVRAIQVEYEEYPACVSVDDALAPGAAPIHDEHPDNILARSTLHVGEKSYDEAVAAEAAVPETMMWMLPG